MKTSPKYFGLAVGS